MRQEVVVGEDRRDELIAALELGMRGAQERAGNFAGRSLPLPGWYDDPWAPGAGWRWWDGWRWTGFAVPTYRGRR